MTQKGLEMVTQHALTSELNVLTIFITVLHGKGISYSNLFLMITIMRKAGHKR